jgi:uncharacterized membrane protein
MTKLEFMKELESLLLDIPLEEREEALQYYNGYFEDAGEDHEDEIIKELGSPSKVASIIKADLSFNAQDRESRGYFTEKGYQDTVVKEEKFEIVGSGKQGAGNNGQNNNTSNTANNGNNGFNSNQANYNRGPGAYNGAGQNKNQGTDPYGQQRNRNTNIGLIILICILGSPILVSIFGVLIGVVSALVGIIIGIGAAGLAMIGAGIALLVYGLVQISVPFYAFLLCGSGLVSLGLGMLFTLACGAICTKALPALIRGIVNLCKSPFKDRSVAA